MSFRRQLFYMLLAGSGMALPLPGAAGQVDCVQLAADRYGLPATVIHAILKVEGGRVGQAVRNRNGSED